MAREHVGVDHSIYDKRRYPIVEVREGYGEWVQVYRGLPISFAMVWRRPL